MLSTNINIRTDAETKSQAQAVFAQMGLDMSTAINLFLKKAIQSQSIPFNLSVAPCEKKKAKLGGWEGKIRMADDFDAPLEDFKEYMI